MTPAAFAATVRRTIAATRRARGITQAGMGVRLAISREGYQNWEIGRTMIRLDDLARIAAALGVEPGELVREEGKGT